MDEAGSRARIGAMTRPPEVKDLEGEIEEIKTKKETAIKEQDFEGAASMRDKEKQAKEKLEAVLNAWRTTREEKRVKVDEEDILHVVSKWTGIPLKRMEQGEADALARPWKRKCPRWSSARKKPCRHVQSVAPFARGLERSEASDWHLCFARADGRRQNVAGQDARGNRCSAIPKRSSSST